MVGQRKTNVKVLVTRRNNLQITLPCHARHASGHLPPERDRGEFHWAGTFKSRFDKWVIESRAPGRRTEGNNKNQALQGIGGAAWVPSGRPSAFDLLDSDSGRVALDAAFTERPRTRGS